MLLKRLSEQLDLSVQHDIHCYTDLKMDLDHWVHSNSKVMLSKLRMVA
jgi:hypothetical protein